MDLIPSSEYEQDLSSQTVWNKFQESLKDDEGFCYYKDTLIASNSGSLPELVIYSQSNQPIIVRCLPYTLDEIEEINNDYWNYQGEFIDSPLLELEDFQIKLKSKFDQDRVLRQKLNPIAVLALPLVGRPDFEDKFEVSSQ